MSITNNSPHSEYMKLLLVIFNEKAEENNIRNFNQKPVVISCAKLIAAFIITNICYNKIATKTFKPEYFWYGEDNYFYDIVVEFSEKYSGTEDDKEKICNQLEKIINKWFMVKTTLLKNEQKDVIKNNYYFEVRDRIMPLFLFNNN
jgi:hypothetical protein